MSSLKPRRKRPGKPSLQPRSGRRPSNPRLGSHRRRRLCPGAGRRSSKLAADQRRGNARPIIIFEFNHPQAEDGRGSLFGNSLELAKFIARDMSGVKTVAYIPRTIKGHAVLAAMACSEIVMAPDAEMGEAGIDEKSIDATMQIAYKEIADVHKTVPPAIALGMLDKSLKVEKVVTEVSTEYVLSTEIDELKKHHAVQSREELSPSPLLFSGRQAPRSVRRPCRQPSWSTTGTMSPERSICRPRPSATIRRYRWVAAVRDPRQRRDHDRRRHRNSEQDQGSNRGRRQFRLPLDRQRRRLAEDCM